MTQDSPPVWRSMLFVPVHVERFVAKAADCSADAVILDLEDSVPPSEKARARGLVRAAAAAVSRQGADVLVRINRPLPEALADIEASIGLGVAALMLPKIAGPEHVRLLAEVIDEVERRHGRRLGATRLVAMVETADAYFKMREIAGASPRLVGMTLGAEDFALSVGMVPEPEGLLHPKLEMVIAARAAGILPLGFVGSVADYRDPAAVTATIRRSKRLGFVGAPCIHPSVVPILNREFSPAAEEVNEARELLAAFDTGLAKGLGAVAHRGRMIDLPIVERARQVLAVHQQIQSRENRTGGERRD